MTAPVDDHLGLLGRSLGDRRLVVFTGVSGSGKSTCIELLVAEHPDFAGRRHTRLGPAPIEWPTRRPGTELVVVDELLRPSELIPLARLLHGGHTVLAASHLPQAWIRLLGARWPAACFRTDLGSQKLERYLSRRGIRHTAAAVRAFADAYGASYTDLEIVLERSAGDDFDAALERFERTATIERTRCVPERAAQAP